MGSATAERELFNLNQAKQFMQTMLHASTIKDLIDAGRTIEVPLSITLDQRNGQRPIIITHLQDQGTVTLFDQGVLRLVGHHKILASGVVRYRITR